jgi:hypothetical protein
MEHADKTRTGQAQRRAASARATVRSAAATVVDNRADAIAQRKLAEAIERSPRVEAQRESLNAIHDSPSRLAQRKVIGSMFGRTAQLAGAREEDLLQGKLDTAQRKGLDEEELLQGRFEAAQRQAPGEEELQMKSASAPSGSAHDSAPAVNNTGLPDNLKSGIESLSGMSMDGVKVHYNSPQPAQLNALAYAQGSDIHVAPGQERHLPHEAWHVVQQAQGRVEPTMQMKDGVPINDDTALEQEADAMGAKALKL